jgi:hypothetical protein
MNGDFCNQINNAIKEGMLKISARMEKDLFGEKPQGTNSGIALRVMQDAIAYGTGFMHFTTDDSPKSLSLTKVRMTAIEQLKELYKDYDYSWMIHSVDTKTAYASTDCDHKWSKYEGFSESYEYCAVCDTVDMI